MAKQELVDIRCRVVSDRESTIAVIDGTEEPDLARPGRKRLKWFWLPRALAEINGDGTVTIPVWLAEEKGLV